MIRKLLLTACVLTLVSGLLHAQPSNPPAPGSWTVVDPLTDNFSSFNSSKWVKRNHDTGPEGHRWAGRRPGKFYTSQSSVQNGKLRITATAAWDPGNEQTNCDYWIKTGFVYSQTKMKKGWYTECSMKASDLSMASSFWLKLGTQNNQEIDITETYGNGFNTRWWDDKIRSNTHFFQNGTDFETKPAPIDVASSSADFPRNRYYRLGMHWKSATQMDIYIDGVFKLTMNTAQGKLIQEDLRLIFDMEPFVPACSSGPGAPLYEHIRPNNPTRRNYMEVEWVKTWKPATTSSGAPLNKRIAFRKTGGDFKHVTAEKTANDNHLLARGNSNASSIGAWEKFDVSSHPQGGVVLKALSNGKYVQSNGANQNVALKAKGNFKGDWERFEWKNKGTNKMALKSVKTGKWVQAAWNTSNAILYPKGQSDQGWETFEYTILGNASRLGGDEEADFVADFEAKVYPNPVVGRAVYIDMIIPEFSDANISMYTLSGQMVYIEDFSDLEQGGYTIQLDLDLIENMKSGIYLVKVKNGDNESISKIVVQ
ncbi:MAG: T9SS type A sorting domain-containing protein [Cyclobacteriaceae bacterium]